MAFSRPRLADSSAAAWSCDLIRCVPSGTSGCGWTAQAATNRQVTGKTSPRQALAIAALVIGLCKSQAGLFEQVFQQVLAAVQFVQRQCLRIAFMENNGICYAGP